MWIKFWACVYRITGWYSPFARLEEYKHIKSMYQELLERYADPDNDMHFEDIVGLEVGMWQAHHKFYRTYKWKKKDL